MVHQKYLVQVVQSLFSFDLYIPHDTNSNKFNGELFQVLRGTNAEVMCTYVCYPEHLIPFFNTLRKEDNPSPQWFLEL